MVNAGLAGAAERVRVRVNLGLVARGGRRRLDSERVELGGQFLEHGAILLHAGRAEQVPMCRGVFLARSATAIINTR